MRYIYQEAVQDGNGKAIEDADVTVYLAGTTTKATIYTAFTGGSADADSVIETGSDGTYTFYVDEDDYSHSQQFKTVMSKSGYTSETWDYLQIFPTKDRTAITDSTADQGDNSIVGTIAWHIADAAGDAVVIKLLPSNYYVATGFTLPKYTSLQGMFTFGMIPREAHEWEDTGNVMYIVGTESITVSEGSSVTGFNILRYGITLPADAAEVTGFTGTAIRLADHAHHVYIAHMGIAGFQWAIDNYNSGGVTTGTNFNYSENLKVEYCALDNTNNIRLGNSLSTAFFNSIKTGTLATITLAGVTTADLERTGYSFHIAGESDGVSIVGCTTYGYAVGFRIESAHSVSIINSQADHPGTPVANTPIGYQIISDDSETVKITGSHVWGGIDVGIYIDNTMGAFQGTTIITGNTISATNHNIQVVDGNAIINGNLIRGGVSGVALGADADIVKVDGNIFHDVDYVINANASFVDSNLLFGNNYYDTVNTAFANNWAIPAVASAGTIAIPLGHKLISITGTTGITSITATFPGHRVSLLFAASLTVTDGSNLKLGGNFSATADDILTLVCDGTNWYQEGNN